MKELEDRITDMEIRYSHQSRLLEELDRVVMEMGQRLHRLERTNQRLHSLLQQFDQAPPESPDE